MINYDLLAELWLRTIVFDAFWQTLECRPSLGLPAVVYACQLALIHQVDKIRP